MAMNDKKKKVADATTAHVQVGGKTSLDVEALRQIIDILEASEVSRLVWSNGDEKLYVRRGPVGFPVMTPHVVSSPGVHVVAPPPAPVAAPAPAAARPSAPARTSAPEASAPEKKGHVISSPFVGTFYRAPAPDQPMFADVGTVVKKGQVLCIIEAMKLMNEIESEVAGRVVEVLAQNSQPVEFGQPLFRIEPV